MLFNTKKLLAKFLKTSDETEINKTSKYLSRFAKDIVKPNTKLILIALFFMMIFSASNAGMAWLIKPIMNQVFIIKEMSSVYRVSLFLILLTFLKTTAQYISTMFLASVSIRVISDARYNLYKKFLSQDMYFFHKNSPGTLMSVIINDVNSINTLASEIPINLGRDFLSFIFLVAVMLFQEPLYASIMLVSIVFIIVPITIVTKKIKSYFNQNNLGFASLTSHLEQVFNGIREVKSYNMEKKEINNVRNSLEGMIKFQLRIRRLSALLPSAMELLGGISVALILLYGGYAVINNGANPGTFFSFIASLLLAYQPLKRLTEVNVKVHMALLGLRRYYSFIDETPKILDKPNAKTLKTSSANITFKNVNFSYDGKQQILKNISFDALAGKKIAFVGRSGGGKSTMINLIARFYDPQSGDILLNDVNIKEYTSHSLREHISFVGQDVVLFDDTIYNNIAYSVDEAKIENVIQASKDAHCFDFINTFPDKFNTQVGARGMKLSGGQKQRISIARALLKNSPILLLDEATSALDTESERYIQIALQKLMENKTTFIIAHRLSTILNSDIILVIDKGQIIESGTHNELLKLNGMYTYFYNLQFKDEKVSNNGN